MFPDVNSLAFLAPAFALLAAVAIIVPLLHKREQRRDIRVPSLVLWRKLQSARGQIRSPHAKPLWTLPVLLQMAAIVLLATALARPVLGPSAATPRHKIYLLDASSGMQAREGAATKFDLARKRLAQELRDHVDPNGPRVSLILAGPATDILLARRVADRDLLGEIQDRLLPSDGRIDWDAAMRLIAGVRRAGEVEELIWISDGVEGPVDAGVPILKDLPISEMRIGAASPNAALHARLAAIDASDRLRLSGKVVFSGGQTEARLDVSFRSDGAGVPLPMASLALKASRNAEPVPFSLDLALVGGGVLTAQLADDANPSDNESRFVVEASIPKAEILVVGRPRPVLQRALQSLPNATVEQRDTLPGDVARYTLVVVVDTTVDRAPESNVLWIGEARLGATPRPNAVEPGDITAWRREHALSRGIIWNNLVVSRASKWARWSEADLILAAGDTPLIEARSGKYGREARIAFDPAREWTSQTSFAQFLDNLLEWTGPVATSRVRAACVVGAPCDFDARWSGQKLVPVGVAEAPPIVTLPIEGRSFVPTRAGLYRLDTGGPATLLAVNSDASGAAAVSTQPLTSSSRPDPVAMLWPWLIAAAALALVAEGILAWRRRAAPIWLAVSRTGVLLLLMAAIFRVPAPVASIEDRTVLVFGATSDQQLFAKSLLSYAAPSGIFSRSPRPAAIAMADGPRMVADLGDAPAPVSAFEPQGGSVVNALRIASAALPPGPQGRIVLVGNMEADAEDLRAVARALRGAQRRVDIARAGEMPPGEVLMADVDAPQTVFAGESFTLSGRIRAAQAGDGRLTVTADGEIVAEQDIRLAEGDNSVDFTIPKAREGDALYEMSIAAAGDAIAENNRNGVRVIGRPAPRILIMSAGIAGKELADGLSQHGFAPKVVVPTGAPWLIEDWLLYDGYVMVDVPAIALNTLQQQLIVDAVSRHGRPLLMFGGAHSFGPGGYLETVLDKLSPLSSRVPKPSPEAAVVYVIDRSGSMSQAVGDVDRLAIAKQATISAMSLLNPQSRVSIIAFDTEARVVAPLQPVTNIVGIRSGISQMTPGGGTDLFPALNLAFDQLRDAESSIKHVIVFTDGLIPPAAFDPLVEQMTAAGISISTVSVGTGGGDNVLRGISRLGRGAFHATNDFRALPSIIAQETMLLSDSAVEERVASPSWVGDRPPFLSGLPRLLPDIEGYVLTTGKPDATVSLKIDTADGGDAPLLASWQFGSGKVMAMTTQLNGPWTKQWMSVPEYRGLWSQAIPHFLSGADASGLTLRATRRREGVAITAIALDKFRKPRAELALVARIVAKDAIILASVPLTEKQPGVYEGFANIVAPGDYVISVADGDNTQTTSVHIAFASALGFEPDSGVKALATATGGQTLDIVDLKMPAATSEWSTAPNWLFWAFAGFIAFCIELLTRYRFALRRAV